MWQVGKIEFSRLDKSQEREAATTVILNLFSTTATINAPAWCSTVDCCGKASNISSGARDPYNLL
jgi:hypothetical protein